MPDNPIELSIEVFAETKVAIERAAAERGLSVAEFLEVAVRRHLVETGYLDETQNPVSGRH